MIQSILLAALAASGQFPIVTPPSPAATPAAVPRYFFTLYAGQSVPFRARTAHTWATYTKIMPAPDGSSAIETFAISWLPADGDVKPLSLRSVVGKNFTHEETLALQAANNGHVSYWGPYEIDGERFRSAETQRVYLESGAPRYRAIDSFNTNRTVINCVHAVTHAEPVVRGRIQPVIRVGEPGTSRLAQLYMRGGAFLGFPERQNWVLEAAGGDPYPTTARLPGETIARQLRGNSPTVVSSTPLAEVSSIQQQTVASPVISETTSEAVTRQPRARRNAPVVTDPSFIIGR